jgi:hypothetical protein
MIRILRPCRFLILSIVVLSNQVAHGQTAAQTQFMTTKTMSPVDYVLSKCRTHKVVILGEGHWIKHDVNLVLQVIPRLRTSGVNALAIEMFRVTDQELLDRIVTGEAWAGDAAAMKIMRSASWPYREYLAIIRTAWQANRNLAPSAEPFRLIAAGPGNDWRERLLPLGQTYDSFMAKTVLEYVSKPGRRILVYAGANHAFTRYYQPEFPRQKRVERFMDRMGNILWRELGEEVYTISFHRPWQCRDGEKWSRCLPLDGVIDCAAILVNHPIGFDVQDSPFGSLNISQDFYFGMGYPSLRFGDMNDGYVWNVPIEHYQAVALIPLSEFASDDESLGFVSQNNPFSDKKGLGPADLEKLWQDESSRLKGFIESSGWQHLVSWRTRCRK